MCVSADPYYTRKKKSFTAFMQRLELKSKSASTKLYKGGKTLEIICYDDGKNLTAESLNKNELYTKQFTTFTQT